MLSYKEARSPELWFKKAHDQLFTGDLLWERLRELIRERKESGLFNEKHLGEEVACLSGAMMFWGYAVENAAKGVWLANDAGALQHVKSHALDKLVTKAGLDTTPYEDLLERLTRYVVWAGRYPIPLSEEAHKASEGKKKMIVPRDQRAVHQLVQDLEALVPQGKMWNK